MFRFLGRSVLLATFVITAASVGGVSSLAQKTDKVKSKNESLACREDQRWHSDRLAGVCEMREQTLAPSGGTIAVDGRQNGGVNVKGWDKNEVLVRARVQASAPTEAEAGQLAQQIRIETGGSKIFASGPDNRRDYHWNVSYEVFVPRRADLSVETHNGGISIADVNGKIDFTALNGGVTLKRIGGMVRGSTTNGGLHIELAGDRWDGDSLDVSTTNGGVTMSVPENYSAHLQTGTVNGGIHVDFPVTVQGQITKALTVDLGAGGPMVKAFTTNGGVHVKRATAND
jgi:DUF4097 and DUF4098 domain-containing protein YvlB